MVSLRVTNLSAVTPQHFLGLKSYLVLNLKGSNDKLLAIYHPACTGSPQFVPTVLVLYANALVN